jgi:polar amino acid transport system substrate-binding protein
MRTSTNQALAAAAAAVVALILVFLLLNRPGATPTPSAGASPSPTIAASASVEASPSESATAPASVAPPISAECQKDSLDTKTAGTLTIGADNPAFPPYYDPPAEGETATAPWELGDPTNKRGFEAAVAWAIAEELGFGDADVTWIPVKFDLSFTPGEKDFDIYLSQVSFVPERAEGADLSDGYYFLNQSLVAVAGTPIASAKSVAELKPYKFGAQASTTSLTYIEEQIQPTQDPFVYDTNDAAIEALGNGQIDGLVVDLPTAFYVTAVQLPEADIDGVIVGQFPPAEAEQEHFSVVLEKGSSLTDCVNQAIAALKDSGELDAITKEWLADKVNAPVLE